MANKNDIECIYRTNVKHTLKSILGFSTSLIMLCCSVFSAIVGLYFISIILLMPAIIIIYLFIFVFPIEISIKECGIIYKTIIRKIYIDFSEILDVKTFFLTRSLAMAGGNKQKADMFCLIKLKKKRFNLLIFSNGIKNYKDLYFQILNSLNSNS